jgi:hypothetical protein
VKRSKSRKREGGLTSNVKLPTLPPVEHIGEGSTWGDREVVAEGRSRELLWLLNTEVGVTLNVVFSDGTPGSTELELSHTNSDNTTLCRVRGCI